MEPRHLFEHQTVEELARALDADGAEAEKRDGALVTLRQRSTTRPLFMVHAAGGSAGGFAHLARALPDRSLHAFQAPGIGSGEPVESIPELARRYVDELRAVQPGGPYLLGGWSFGALVAHEMARLLEADGEAVERLVLVEPAPPRTLQAPSVDVDALDPHDLPPEALRLLGLPDGEPDDALLRRRLAVLRAHVRSMAAHEPGTVTAPAVLLLTNDTGGKLPRLAPAWNDLLHAPAEAHTVPGDHDRVLDAEHAPALAALLGRILGPEVTA